MKPIDVAMIQQINEVSNIELSQDHKPMVEQQTISTMVQKEVEVKAEVVTSKDDVENREQKYDAKEKSGNEYEDGKKGRYEKKNKSDGKVFLKGHNIADFDIKI